MVDCELNSDSSAIDLCVKLCELRFTDSETVLTYCMNSNSLAAVRARKYESPHVYSRKLSVDPKGWPKQSFIACSLEKDQLSYA